MLQTTAGSNTAECGGEKQLVAGIEGWRESRMRDPPALAVKPWWRLFGTFARISGRPIFLLRSRVSCRVERRDRAGAVEGRLHRRPRRFRTVGDAAAGRPSRAGRWLPHRLWLPGRQRLDIGG